MTCMSLLTSKTASKHCSTIEKSFHISSIILIYIYHNIKGKTRFRCITLRSSDNLKPFDTDYKWQIHESNSFFCGYAQRRRWQSFYCLRYDKTEWSCKLLVINHTVSKFWLKKTKYLVRRTRSFGTETLYVYKNCCY